MKYLLLGSILIFLLFIITYWAIKYVEEAAIRKVNNRMSFKESLDLVGLPIVTFNQGNYKYHFILDTGSTLSVVNKDSLCIFNHSLLNKKGTNYGCEGNIVPVDFIKANIEYKNNVFEEEFQVVDLSKAFENIKNDHGVKVIGILGNSFFTKYKYILDFDELAAYR